MSASRRQRATEPNIMAELADFFVSEQRVLFAYLFGSRARSGQSGPLSDLDLAVCLDDQADFFATRLHLMASLARRIRTEKFDLVVLNEAPLILRYEVVKDGIVLKEDKPRRVLFETEVVRTYLDTQPLRDTQCRYLKASLRNEAVHG